MTKHHHETSAYLQMCRRIIRAAGRRVGHADIEDLAVLISIGQELDDAIVVAIRGLRNDGYTWERIGEAFGVTRQAVIMRWSSRVAG